jgi:hypothetical protein
MLIAETVVSPAAPLVSVYRIASSAMPTLIVLLDLYVLLLVFVSRRMVWRAKSMVIALQDIPAAQPASAFPIVFFAHLARSVKVDLRADLLGSVFLAILAARLLVTALMASAVALLAYVSHLTNSAPSTATATLVSPAVSAVFALMTLLSAAQTRTVVLTLAVTPLVFVFLSKTLAAGQMMTATLALIVVLLASVFRATLLALPTTNAVKAMSAVLLAFASLTSAAYVPPIRTVILTTSVTC